MLENFELKLNLEDTTLENDGYIVSIYNEIKRVLMTPIGSRVMNPFYGSEYYLLRDRDFDDEWRLMAIKYTFEAIQNNIARVFVKRVLFDNIGEETKITLELERR